MRRKQFLGAVLVLLGAALVFGLFSAGTSSNSALGLFGFFKKSSPQQGQANQAAGGGTTLYCRSLGDVLQFRKAGGVGILEIPTGVSLTSVFNSRRVTVTAPGTATVVLQNGQTIQVNAQFIPDQGPGGNQRVLPGEPPLVQGPGNFTDVACDAATPPYSRFGAHALVSNWKQISSLNDLVWVTGPATNVALGLVSDREIPQLVRDLLSTSIISIPNSPGTYRGYKAWWAVPTGPIGQ